MHKKKIILKNYIIICDLKKNLDSLRLKLLIHSKNPHKETTLFYFTQWDHFTSQQCCQCCVGLMFSSKVTAQNLPKTNNDKLQQTFITCQSLSFSLEYYTRHPFPPPSVNRICNTQQCEERLRCFDLTSRTHGSIKNSTVYYVEK